MKSTPETITLAIKIADSCARADVECQCMCVSLGQKRPPQWDLNSIDDGSREAVMESVRYLDLRGLIHHDADKPHIVSFPEIPD